VPLFPQLTPDELTKSLMTPIRFEPDAMLFAAVTSLRKDGSPLTVPQGFWFDGVYFYLTMVPERGSVKRLRRDPRICLCFHNWSLPAYFITVTGVADEFEDPVHEMSLKITRRYPKGAAVDEEEFDRQWLRLGQVVFRIRIESALGIPFGTDLMTAALQRE
jgi:hypothetical protein